MNLRVFYLTRRGISDGYDIENGCSKHGFEHPLMGYGRLLFQENF